MFSNTMKVGTGQTSATSHLQMRAVNKNNFNLTDYQQPNHILSAKTTHGFDQQLTQPSIISNYSAHVVNINSISDRPPLPFRPKIRRPVGFRTATTNEDSPLKHYQ
jgi:hypothetical protein